MCTVPVNRADLPPILTADIDPVGAEGPAPRGLDDRCPEQVARLCRRRQHEMGVDGNGSISGVVRGQGEGTVGQGEDQTAVADAEEIHVVWEDRQPDHDLVVGDPNQFHTQ